MQAVFGYLDKSVESSLAKEGSSKVCKNIDVTEGYIKPYTESSNATEYLQACTMFKREYSINSTYDIVRSDDTTVGVEVLSLPMQLEKASGGSAGAGLVDPWEALKIPLFRLMWYELYGAYPSQASINTYLDKMEKTGLYLYPIYKIIYNDGEAAGYVSFGDEVVGTKIALQDNFWYRVGASISNFPSYSDTVSFIVSNSLQRSVDSGEYAFSMTNANLSIGGNKWLGGDGGLVTSEISGSPTKSISKIEMWVEQQFKGRFSTIVPNHYGSYFCRIAELDYSATPITGDGGMPETIDISFDEITTGLDDADVKFLSTTLRQECGSSYTTYPAINFDEVETGTLSYIYTNKQILYGDDDYWVESIPSQEYTMDIYADDTNKSTKITFSLGLATYNNDGSDEYWNLNDTDAQYLRIYRREPTQSQHYLLTEINLQRLLVGAPTPVITKYDDEDDAGYTTINTDVYDDTDDGTVKYLKMTIVDNMLPLDKNEYMASDSNYPPNYNVETGEEYGDVKYILTHNNRLFYVVDNLLFFSEVDEPEYYPAENFIQFHEDITGLASWNEVLYIGTDAGIHVLYGNGSFENYTLKTVDSEMSCLDNSMIACQYGIFFVSNGEGVYRINGSLLEKISSPLGSDDEESITAIDNCEFKERRFLVWEQPITTAEEDRHLFWRFDCQLGGWSTSEYTWDLSSTTDLLPVMTAETTDDFTITGSAYYSDRYPWKVGDNSPSTFWEVRPYSSSTGAWLKVEFPDTNTDIVFKYGIRSYATGTSRPKAWTLHGSADDTNWTLLDTQTGVTDWASGVSETKTYTFETATHYKYYKFTFTDSNEDTLLDISEINLYAKTLETGNYTEWQSNNINFKSPINAKEVPRFHVEYSGTVDFMLYKDDVLTSTTALTSTGRTHKIIYGDNKKFHALNYKIVLKDSSSYFYSIDIPNIKR